MDNIEHRASKLEKKISIERARINNNEKTQVANE